MAKAKAEVNKSEAIRAVLADKPAASVKEVVATLKAKGIDVSENLVYSVKKTLGKKKATKATVKAAAPASNKSANKSEEIRTVFAATPAASAKDVVATLKAKGIDVSENYVYGVKKTMKPGKKKPGRKPKATATVVLTKAAPSSNGHLSVGASIAVAKAAAEKVGGWSALKEIVDALA
jgi:post-segregation antitoxin (ccd killing protein)